MTFTKETYKSVFEAADRVFNSARQVNVAVAAVTSLHDETLPAFSAQNQPTAEVAAIAGKKKNKKNKKNKKDKEERPRGPRHASLPPESCCDRHYVHGADAWYCLAPTTCPWKDRCTARPK